jgi:radical SAM superfamily enzyme YgiQ (UPF0313 family)
VSGECYYAIDYLMKCMSLAMGIEDRTVSKARTVELLQTLAVRKPLLRGRAVIGCRLGKEEKFIYFNGTPIDMGELPSPYQPFAIRARFPIFPSIGLTDRLTAHVLTSSACPYQCNFCSEASNVVGKILKFGEDPIKRVLGLVISAIEYGAEAAFFDDSVLFAGRLQRIKLFSESLGRLRANPELAIGEANMEIRSEVAERLSSFVWGAQFTVEFLASLQDEESSLALLAAMRSAGCGYIYFGLESMADQVIRHVHKNRIKPNGQPWRDKVRKALLIVRRAQIKAGTAVLFGLEGETRESIDETIAGVAELIRDDLIDVSSPSILTYHPGTPIARSHGMTNHLDYHSTNLETKAPYIFFEQAFAGVVSKLLTEDDVWHIHRETSRLWGFVRNTTPMVVPTISVAESNA